MQSKSGWSKPRHPECARWVAGSDVRPAPLAYRGGMVLHPSQRIELGSPAEVAIVIRPSRPEDERALERLAGLDSASVPALPLLLAEADGALRAALSLQDGVVIADPFHRTAPLVALLVARSQQLQGEPSRRRRWISRRRLAIAGA